MQNETLSIFEPACQDNEEKIFAHGIREEIKRMCHELGGVTETARKLNLKFKQVCEWPWRGKPIPLKQLDRMIEFLPAEKRLEYRQRFDEKEFYLSANYSGHKMKFPKKLSPELCYIVGLLLGDGSISGSFQKGFRKRVIQVFFDSSDHAELYSYLLVSTFALKPKKYPRRGCVCLSISSFVFHWFFCTYFGFIGGKKADRIIIPDRIFQTQNTDLTKPAFAGCLIPTDLAFQAPDRFVMPVQAAKYSIKSALYWKPKAFVLSAARD